jgi:hypothetical protein
VDKNDGNSLSKRTVRAKIPALKNTSCIWPHHASSSQAQHIIPRPQLILDLRWILRQLNTCIKLDIFNNSNFLRMNARKKHISICLQCEITFIGLVRPQKVCISFRRSISKRSCERVYDLTKSGSLNSPIHACVCVCVCVWSYQTYVVRTRSVLHTNITRTQAVGGPKPRSS